MPKLNQILAVEKSVKSKNESRFTAIYQDLQKSDLLNGFSKLYQPKADGDEVHPPQVKRVQLRADDALAQLRDALVELFDATAARDATNCVAKANVEVDGKVLLENVPATHLLFIEKKLADLITTFKKLPILSMDEDWSWNQAQSLWQTSEALVTSTKKVEAFNVIVPATKEHPAQVAKEVKDVPVGTWTTVKFSGALTRERAEKLLRRAEAMYRAVKFAREEANQTPVKELKTGAVVLDYVFG